MFIEKYCKENSYKNIPSSYVPQERFYYIRNSGLFDLIFRNKCLFFVLSVFFFIFANDLRL